jgi:hypothetical protein
MIYIYPEQDLRAYPGTFRGTDDWITTYKERGVVEKTINHFKIAFVSLIVKLKTLKHYMQTYCYLELLNYSPLYLLIRYKIINTSGA